MECLKYSKMLDILRVHYDLEQYKNLNGSFKGIHYHDDFSNRKLKILMHLYCFVSDFSIALVRA